MSTILKALRRLEQEKSTRSDRPLGEAVAGAAPTPAPRATASRRWPMFAGIAIGIAVLGVASIAVIRWSRSADESAPVEVAAVPEKPGASTTPARQRAKAKQMAAERRQRANQNSNETAPAPGEPPPGIVVPPVAASKRPQPRPEAPIGSSPIPPSADAAAVSGWTGVQLPESPVTPASGETPVIDLSKLEALRAAAKSAGKKPETVASARRAPTRLPPSSAETPPSAPTPKSPPATAPVDVAVARPTEEPIPTPKPAPARATELKAAPTPKVAPEVEVAAPVETVAKAKVAAPPKPAPEPEAPPERSVARKSPPRPSAPRHPEVYVSRTVWHPDASRRVAYVELEGRDEVVALREGESIGPLLVTEIAPTGVSFDNRGSELKRRVGAR